MKLEPDLRAEFMAEAAGEDRPASQVMRQLMRDYIAQRRQEREYRDYLQGKVEAARASMHAGRGSSNHDVEAAFAARRRKVAAQP
ncbi:antitoxin of toxin-antitoxin stability system [Xanthomonas arboricola pv. corylina]|uniref:antitoxin of toxin-antitoxin stability system n=1 Tax=Xanthomonas arboricola TaxID=56448 RepID=UPI0040407C6A